ncbi:MAG: hypothetical protein RLN75_04635 [Longimicrobiales bacterium]
MLPRSWNLALAVSSLALTACTAGQVTMGPPPRPGEPTTAFTEPLRDRPGFELYVRNDLDEAIRLTSITLYECDNVRNGCTQWDPEITLDPGEVRRVYTVEPALRNRGFSYRWRYTFDRLESGGGSGS